jgi:hypothetical protein
MKVVVISGLAIAGLAAALLSGCALEPRRTDVPVESRVIVQSAPPSEPEQLVSYLTKARSLESREFALEREAARSQFQADKSDINRLKLAWLTAMAPISPSTPADDAEAMSVLEPIIARPSASTDAAATATAENRTLAGLLHAMLSERRKLRDQLRDTQNRLAIAKRDEGKDAEARALRVKVEELEKKLSVLKSIDRSVNRRTDTGSK